MVKRDRLTSARSDARTDRRPLFWRDGGYRAVQSEGWKLIDSPAPRRQWLFHLAQDPTERNNLIDKEGAQRERLERLLREHHANCRLRARNTIEFV